MLDTLNAITTTSRFGFVIDQTVRDAHFVCSRADAAAIVMATAGVTDCLRISAAQLNTAIPLVRVDATLSGLTLSDGTDLFPLTPVFASGTTTYTVAVANSVTSVTVTPTATNAIAMITVNGDTVTSGSASSPIDLTAGTPMVIPVIVTATDTTTRMTYMVTATRALPTVSRVAFSSTGPYALGEAIRVTVTFSENVTVTGIPGDCAECRRNPPPGGLHQRQQHQHRPGLHLHGDRRRDRCEWREHWRQCPHHAR